MSQKILSVLIKNVVINNVVNKNNKYTFCVTFKYINN